MKSLPPTPEPVPVFKPVAITFLFETQDELDAMAATFSHADVYKAINTASGNPDMGSVISDGLEHLGASYVNKFSIIADYISKDK